MPKYLYKGKEVLVKAKYSNVWIVEYKNDKKSRMSLNPRFLDKKPDDWAPNATPLRSETGEFANVQFPFQVAADFAPPATPEEDLLDINNASEQQLIDLPGIGRSRARSLIENRPSDGYSDLEQLEALNEGTRISIDVLGRLIRFGRVEGAEG